MANIVYILGAGASAQAIPTVADSMCRFEVFLILLETKVSISKFESESTRLTIQERVSIYRDLLNKCKEHMSFDTLAKKLYLKQDTETLHYLKEFLTLYYLFEHYTSQDFVTVIDEYKTQLENKSQDEIDELMLKALRYHLNPIDFRYDAFIAGISDNTLLSRLFIPNNVSILSWNYDLQLEFALNEYDRFESKRLDYMFNPIEHNNSEHKNEISNDYVKLNGCAGYMLHNADNQNLRTYSGNKLELKMFEIPSEHDEDILTFIIDTLEEFANNTYFNKLHPFINFAWEDNALSKITVNRAKLKIEAADSIVIIGYSFPTFNRNVDEQLFSKIDLGRDCKIYIQAINESEYIKIRTRIQGIGNSLNNTDFEFIDDVSQFYVPFEFNKDVSRPYSRY